MRQTAAEIDHAILDVAAGLFARHGFAHTSVQQMADAVGYSKPGLLHRFGSKDALFQAALSEVTSTAAALASAADQTSDREVRVPRLLDLLARQALRRPGMTHLFLELLEAPPTPETAPAQEAGRRVLEALDPPGCPPVPRLRSLMALRLVVSSAQTQHATTQADLHLDPETHVALVTGLAAEVLDLRLSP